ncbi:Uncharacterised protein [Serratia rubidaea]|uniref:Uncharacterized protein n=1 Tax=Serratia rubidaea TaxID=61652 RepID=A0A4U9HS14_SERRU|nr:hypothetical protein [Serratia rubidaea]QPR64349.1 hypothetical protein I6G83_03540 [Serratia rubidaea]CAI1075865.1 Uncharacterised protein [Serratia rubidaea]CAI1888800.1 Uncharacterised protein [Serratia rubidaea]VTP67187.1 Uncharacterised protein [Serratia rubidaea]HAY0638424.1 hypothetical protein [Serratia rubidaea]
MKLNGHTLNEIEEKALAIIHREVDEYTPKIPVMYLEGGHYDPRYPVNEFAQKSLRHALDIANNAIARHKKDLKISLGILIDDLGLQCGVESCEIAPELPENSDGAEEHGELPNALAAILAQYKIVKRERMVIQGERACKNRGIQTLKRILERHKTTPFPELEIEESAALTRIFFVNEEGQRVLLAESKAKDVWTAKCPVIMAQHYSDVYDRVAKLHPQSHALHIIDFSETDDYNKVINGADVAMKLFLRNKSVGNRAVKITNIFLSSFDDEDYIIHSTSHCADFVAVEA